MQFLFLQRSAVYGRSVEQVIMGFTATMYEVRLINCILQTFSKLVSVSCLYLLKAMLQDFSCTFIYGEQFEHIFRGCSGGRHSQYNIEKKGGVLRGEHFLCSYVGQGRR